MNIFGVDMNMDKSLMKTYKKKVKKIKKKKKTKKGFGSSTYKEL